METGRNLKQTPKMSKKPKDDNKARDGSPLTATPGSRNDAPSRDEWVAESPRLEDTFTRQQIIEYLDEIPLGYRTEGEHEVTEGLIDRAKRHFAQLATTFEPPWD